MRINIEYDKNAEQTLSECLQKQKQKPKLRELGIPALDSLYKQAIEKWN